MLLELLKNYADMINSATRMTQRSATAMARTMLIQAGMEPAADMVSKLSEQMIAAQEAQYAMMRQMIQTEVDMTVTRMGVLPVSPQADGEEAAGAASDQDERVAELKVVPEREGGEPEGDTSAESDLHEAESAEPEVPRLQPVPATDESGPATAEASAEAKPTVAARKAPAKRAAARKTAAGKTAIPRKSTAAKSTATKSTAAKSTAAKSTATKSTAAKRSARKAPTKAAAPGTGTPKTPKAPTKSAPAKSTTNAPAGDDSSDNEKEGS